MTKYLFIFYLIGVVIVSTAPLGGLSKAMNQVGVLSIRLDYLLHALVFIPLFPLWRWGLSHHNAWMVLFAGLLLAIMTEAVQRYLPYRAYNINDLLANAAGVLVGVLLFFLMNKIIFQQPELRKASRTTTT